jgi:tetratricopeptide (TPR) repeat protein
MFLTCLLPIAACAGVSPSPEAIAAQEHTPAVLDAVGQQDLQSKTEAALQALTSGDPELAVSQAEAALALDPAAPRPRAALGLALLRQAMRRLPPDLNLQSRGDGETLAASRAAPADLVVGLMRTRFLAESGHLSAAAAAGEACLKLQGMTGQAEYVPLLATTAALCHELGEERRASPWCIQLAERQPDDAGVQYRLGENLLEVADSPAMAAAGARAFAKCADLAPDDLAARLAVVACQVRAAELADKAGKSSDAANFLGEAAKACADAAARFPKLAEPWFRAGVVAEQRNDSAAARTAYERALQIEPEHMGSLLNYAAVLDASKETADKDAAKAAWRRALARDAASGGLKAAERSRIEARLAQ